MTCCRCWGSLRTKIDSEGVGSLFCGGRKLQNSRIIPATEKTPDPVSRLYCCQGDLDNYHGTATPIDARLNSLVRTTNENDIGCNHDHGRADGYHSGR